jgi:hypothetical protein
MIGDYYCKSAFSSNAFSSEVTLVVPRSRLLSMVVRPRGATAYGESKSLVFKDGSGGTVLYELVIPTAAGAAQARVQPSILIQMGGDGILFENGIYAEIGSSGVGTGSACCISDVTIFYT